ncbi:hypothetical protein STEG23_011280 [Scotinomys teguina]
MQPGRTTNTGGRTMEVKAAAPRCQLLLILLMSAVMLLPGTNGSLLLVQRTVTRTIVLQETIGKGVSNWKSSSVTGNTASASHSAYTDGDQKDPESKTEVHFLSPAMIALHRTKAHLTQILMA